MIGELFHDMMNSSTQGFVGVSLIFVYLVWIVATALVRIKEGKEHGHH